MTSAREEISENISTDDKFGETKILRPVEELLFPVTKGRYSVPLMKTPRLKMTSPTLGMSLPPLIYRDESAMSGYTSTSPGPITRESSNLRNSVRAKRRGDARYVKHSNRYAYRAKRENSQSWIKVSKSTSSLVSVVHFYILQSYTFLKIVWGH